MNTLKDLKPVIEQVAVNLGLDLDIPLEIDDGFLVCKKWGIFIEEIPIAQPSIKGVKMVPGFKLSVGGSVELNRYTGEDYLINEITQSIFEQYIIETFFMQYMKIKAQQAYNSLANQEFSEMLEEEHQKETQKTLDDMVERGWWANPEE